MDVSLAPKSPPFLDEYISRLSALASVQGTTTAASSPKRGGGIWIGDSAIDLRYRLPDMQLAITFTDSRTAQLPRFHSPRPSFAQSEPHSRPGRLNPIRGVSPTMERTAGSTGVSAIVPGPENNPNETAAIPSSQQPASDTPRSKVKKFDIRISHFSDMAANEDTSGSTETLNTNNLSQGKERVAGPIRTKRPRTGRERIKIELAPDQPATTQGKPRERVYVACLQCRSRKIRCDGAKPMCFNCQQRSTGCCEYDNVPKRRGPDRVPGSRQRPVKVEKERSSSKRRSSDAGSNSLGGKVVSTSHSTDQHEKIGMESGLASLPTVAVHSSMEPTSRDRRGSSTLPANSINSQNTWASVTLPAHRDGQAPIVPPQPIHVGRTIVSQEQELASRSAMTARLSPTEIGGPSYGYSISHARHNSRGSVSSTITDSPPLSVPRISTTTGLAHSSVTPPSSSSVSEPYTPADIYSGNSTYTADPLVYGQNADPASAASLFSAGAENHRQATVGIPQVPVDHYGGGQAEYSYDANADSLSGDVGGSSARRGSLVLSTSSATSGLSSSASPDSSSLGEYLTPDVSTYAPHAQPYIVDFSSSGVEAPHMSQQHLSQNITLQHQLQYQHQQEQDPTSFAALHQHNLNVDIPPLLRHGNEWQKADTYNTGTTARAYAPHENVLHTSVESPVYSYNPYQWAVPAAPSVGYQTTDTAYITPTEEEESTGAERQQQLDRQTITHLTHGNFDISLPPSLDFVRKTWWDSLLETYAFEYCSPRISAHNQAIFGVGGSITCSAPPTLARQESTILIGKDLQFLFRSSNFWFAFINVPLFFQTFLDPGARDKMQPALVLALLGMSYFLRSSEVELGEEGRMRTLWLMNKAQAALETSVNASWIDGELAQAAWLVALFEIAAHPHRCTPRTEAAFTTLDNIIRTLSLTFIDAHDSSASTYSPQENPSSSNSYSYSQPQQEKSYAYPQPLYCQPSRQHSRYAPRSQLLHHQPSHDPNASQTCACMQLSLAKNWPLAQEHTPLWLCTPAWDPNWSVAEIRREECRRLCWNALAIAAGYTTYRAALGVTLPDLFVIQPANFRLQFPGENLTQLMSAQLAGIGGTNNVTLAKETVWALYARAMLLWHACVRIRAENNVSDHERARFASAVWKEADAIEDALNYHSCPLERAFLYQGREYLFNARMYISYEFRRFVPSPNTGLTGAVHRLKAQEWLRHQAEVAKRIMQGLHTVTLQKNNILARRPFFIFWFMGQISRCLQLWALDNSLTFAIELSKEFLPPIDYLTALWPCTDQRQQYAKIRHRLEQACLTIGLTPPPPPNFSLPTSAQALP